MKLYTYDPAPNPRRLALFLKHKGVAIASHQIDLLKGGQFEESFLRLNPRATVPTLVLDDGSVLADTLAICFYLDTHHEGISLFGQTELEKAQVLGMCHRIFSDGFIPVADILRNTHPNYANKALPGTDPVAQIPALAERGGQRIERFFTDMDTWLSSRQFLVGTQLSQADIDLLVVVDFAGWVKRRPPASCTALAAYLSQVRELLGE